ncbi:MAG TPA: DUF4248 domain-containing protein [Chitinophagaceae bacterium]|jgi:transposase|nr:DUF4248 domain-containing protein [Chitinophagaceae bacterium]
MPTEVKAYSKKELAQLYCVSVKVLRTWLKPFKNTIGNYDGKMYTPKQIKTIFDCLGEP